MFHLPLLLTRGVSVDTVFFPPSICMLNPKKPKNIIFSPWGHENIYNGMTQPVWTLEHSKYIFSAKMTKMPLVKGQNPHKTTFFMVLYQTGAPWRFLATLTKFDPELTPSGL